MRQRPRVIFRGDAAACAKWLTWAKKRLADLQDKTASRSKRQERVTPDGKTWVTIELNPARIVIESGGKQLLPVMDQSEEGALEFEHCQVLPDEAEDAKFFYSIGGGVGLLDESPSTPITKLRFAAIARMVRKKRWDLAFITISEFLGFGSAYLKSGWETSLDGVGALVVDTAHIVTNIRPLFPTEEERAALDGLLESLAPFAGAISRDATAPSELWTLPAATGSGPPASPEADSPTKIIGTPAMSGQTIQYAILSPFSLQLPERLLAKNYRDVTGVIIYTKTTISWVLSPANFPPWDSMGDYYYVSSYTKGIEYFEREYREAIDGFVKVGSDSPIASELVGGVSVVRQNKTASDSDQFPTWFSAVLPGSLSLSVSYTIPSPPPGFDVATTKQAPEFGWEENGGNIRFESALGRAPSPLHYVTIGENFSLAPIGRQPTGTWAFPRPAGEARFTDKVSGRSFVLNGDGLFSIYEPGEAAPVVTDQHEALDTPAGPGEVITHSSLAISVTYEPYTYYVPSFPDGDYFTGYGKRQVTTVNLHRLKKSNGLSYVLGRADGLDYSPLWTQLVGAGQLGRVHRNAIYNPSTGSAAFFSLPSAETLVQRRDLRKAWASSTNEGEKAQLMQQYLATFTRLYQVGNIPSKWLMAFDGYSGWSNAIFL